MSFFTRGAWIAFWTLISRIFGLVREWYIATALASTTSADVVQLMFKYPNFFRRSFSEGAISGVFIPSFNKKLRASPEEAASFANQILGLFFIVAAVVVIVFELFTPALMYLLAPGFCSTERKFASAVFLCRISLPYLICLTIVAIFGSVLNSFERFFAYAISPAIASLTIIAAVKFSSGPSSVAYNISLALLIGGVLQVLFMYFFISKLGIAFPRIPYSLSKVEVSNFVSKFVPTCLASSVVQVQGLILQAMVSCFEGGLANFAYAERLCQLPVAIFGVAFSSALLPLLSRAKAHNDYETMLLLQGKAIRLAWMIAVPCAVGTCICSLPIVQLVYQYGNFSQKNSLQVATILSCFSLGIPAIVLSRLLQTIFYVNRDTATLMQSTAKTLLCTVLLSGYLFYQFDLVGVALGGAIAQWVQLYILLSKSLRSNYVELAPKDRIWALKVLAFSVPMGVIVFCARLHFGLSDIGVGFITRLAALSYIALAGIIPYFLALLLGGLISISFEQGLSFD